MILAGKVDRRLLKKTIQEKYGSNFALAQSRAAWVRRCLLDEKILGLEPEKIVALATGPELIKKSASNKSVEDDRVVRCYAFWTKKQMKKVSPNSSSKS